MYIIKTQSFLYNLVRKNLTADLPGQLYELHSLTRPPSPEQASAVHTRLIVLIPWSQECEHVLHEPHEPHVPCK